MAISGSANSATVSGIEPGLAEHIQIEFGDHGRRTTEFLETAARLLQSQTGQPPRLAETVAYALREAMTSILGSQDRGGRADWSKISRSVTAAAKHYKDARGFGGPEAQMALEDLLRKVQDLDRFHEEEKSIHRKRLIAVMVKRTGFQPTVTGKDLVQEYQQLLGRLTPALHNELTMCEAGRVCTGNVCQFLGRCSCHRRSEVRISNA